MRYVDIDELRLRDGWLEEAEAATRAVVQNGAVPGERDQIWRDVKAKLADLLHDKCWFCETPIPRSDNAVDHFRPKGRVSDAKQEHSGYRWLAFERGNFRYACTYCNSRRIDVEHGTSGGKADRFPLVDEAARVYEVDVTTLDFSDLLRTVRKEQPEILDPCDLEDWKLLGCQRENGHPCPTSSDKSVVDRVQKSIEVYHLNHEPTCKQRHREAVMLLEAVREAKAAFLRIDDTNPDTKADFRGIAKRIQRMINRKAPYSGEMIFLLRGQRSPDHPWIRQLLEL
ncbi:hypothetical protein [Azospirillum soli]|uniref:hypothetical protein n=1 Tax=Azospirillum soli TaxID=1304799 RepID=UPI001AE25CF1|nr:hypothetical protein [Azospirillum soli]MBP2316273.1 hypothetical protein [Azospirillum soli]